MKFRVEFDLDNAAFDFNYGDEGDRDAVAVDAQLSRVGRAICSERGGMVLKATDSGKVRDVNGNTIGKWEVVA